MDPSTSLPDGLVRRSVFGLQFVDDTSIDRVAQLVLECTPSEVHPMPVVVTPNTDLLLQAMEPGSREVWELFERCWCVLPDGQPIVWASRLLGTPLRFRLTGSDLFAHLWPRLAEAGVPTFVLTAGTAISEGLERTHAGATTLVAPMIDATSVTDIESLAARCASLITEHGSRVVVLGLGHPKDSLLAAAILRLLGDSATPLPFVLCLGGSAEMYLGIRKRAPEWVQRISAEWLYRFAQEPRRLFHRYFVRDIGFLRVVWREYRTARSG